MHYTLQKLIEGDEEIVTYYQKAKSIWNEITGIIDCNNSENIPKLANELSSRQIIDFEYDCGGKRYWSRNYGMVWYRTVL